MEECRHEYWMNKAIELAKTAWGRTHPNPMVGSLLVHNERIIASGFHEKAGEFHAERAALTGITLTHKEKEEAFLYVTLEPCCTHGKTPPCTDIILEKGILNVVIGALDPNPKHLGKGIEILKKAGVAVTTGVLCHECEDLNLIFNHTIQQSTPLIALKSAVTLDGKIATEQGYSKWITENIARENVMHWRQYFPAIGVGAGTAISDNPSLTIRQNNRVVDCPIRFIFDRSLHTLDSIHQLNVFNDEWNEKTVLITSSKIDNSLIKQYENKGCRVCMLDYHDSDFPITSFKSWCWDQNITGIYIEGGPSLSSSFINQKGADYLFVYQAPKLFVSDQAPSMVSGGKVTTPSEAPFIEKPTYEVLGNDILCRGHLSYAYN